VPSSSNLTMHGTREGMWFTGALSYGWGVVEVQVPLKIVAKSKSHLEDATSHSIRQPENGSFTILILLGGRARKIYLCSHQMYAKLCSRL
jgi:hypothetical protein